MIKKWGEELKLAAEQRAAEAFRLEAAAAARIVFTEDRWRCLLVPGIEATGEYQHTPLTLNLLKNWLFPFLVDTRVKNT